MVFTKAMTLSFPILLRRTLDFILPPLCPMTGRAVGEAHTIDPAYWAQLTFIQAPMCAQCGAPFDKHVLDGIRCGACLQQPPHFARARAALKYDDASAPLILKFKHADATHLSPLLAQWLQQAGREILADAHLLLPVPLHRRRLLRRRYNQAALLAAMLAEKSSVPCDPLLLRRIKHTESQGQKTRTQRLENVGGVFSVTDAAKVKDKNIILIDDVLTTGATVNECAKTLLKAGAARVDVLVVARVGGAS